MAASAPAPKAVKFDEVVNDEDSNEKEVVDGAATDEEQIILERVVGIQREIDRLNERASEEILHVEQKYNKLRQPHYKLLNNSQFADLLSGEDETALQYLSNLVVEEYEDPNSGYRISFFFRENPYFENEVISKEVVMDISGETTVNNTAILWKEGKDLTIRNNDTFPLDGTRKRGLEEQPSFFSWFSADNLLEEPGEIIRDDIWPNPLQHYLNPEATLNETYDEEDEDGLEEKEEEEDGLEEKEEEDGLEEKEEEEDGLEEEEEEEEEDDQDDPDVIDLSDDEEDEDDV